MLPWEIQGLESRDGVMTRLGYEITSERNQSHITIFYGRVEVVEFDNGTKAVDFDVGIFN